jgi:hypothetical protein
MKGLVLLVSKAGFSSVSFSYQILTIVSPSMTRNMPCPVARSGNWNQVFVGHEVAV